MRTRIEAGVIPLVEDKYKSDMGKTLQQVKYHAGIDNRSCWRNIGN